MKALWKTGLVAALMGAVIAIPARAQDAPKKIMVEVGTNYVMDSDVRDAVGDFGWRIGLGYVLPTKGFLSPVSQPSANISYAQNKDGGNKLTVWGLMYEERVPFAMSNPYATTKPYWGLGIGINFLDAEAEYIPDVAYTSVANADGTITESEDATNLGLRALLGMEFAKDYYAELSYNWTQDVADADGNSIALVIGARF